MSGRETDYAAWIEKAEHDLLSNEKPFATERLTPLGRRSLSGPL